MGLYVIFARDECSMPTQGEADKGLELIEIVQGWLAWASNP